jgi:hypothetical protein
MPRKENHTYTEVDDPSIIKETILELSTIENIDGALFEFINNMGIHTSTNKGFKKVPVLWTSAERAYQIKQDEDLRDASGTHVLPVISIERNNITKDPQKKGAMYGNASSDQRITVARRINQEKTKKFANAEAHRLRSQHNFPKKNKQVVYETITMPMPVYIDVQYNIKIRAEYQQQLNEIVTPFVNIGRGINYFLVSRNGHRYEAFMQPGFDLDSNITNLGEEERRYETQMSVKVLGYLIGNDKNEDPPKLVRRENFVNVKIGRERVIFGDIPDHISSDKADFRD